MRMSRRRAVCVVAVCASLGAPQVFGQACVPPGKWWMPAAAESSPTSQAQVYKRAAASGVVLLGELHDQAEHHRWQLHTMAGLHALGGELVLGFEMFPRRVQPVLDRWVAGELSAAQFLRQSDWVNVWGFDPALYLPLFDFARMHRIPMVALNVERSLIREVGRKGESALQESQREGVGRPAPPPDEYRKYLFEVFQQHDQSRPAKSPDAPAFLRFVESQTFWDRAMAEAIRDARRKYPGRQFIGIMGSGHTLAGGVPHQLRALGIDDTMVMRPWEANADCARLTLRVADAVFGIDVSKDGAERDRPPPRLGVVLNAVEGGIRIDQVGEGSIAAQAGLRGADVILTIAGVKPGSPGDVAAIIRRQAPGTWLPLRIRRAEGELDIVARFPPAAQ